MIKSRIAAGAALLAVAGFAHAGEFSVTPTITNDYDFRGVTQTEEDPALQLGANYAFDNGFYVGAWGSNVKFAGDKGTEVDLFAGYAGSTDTFNYDLGAVYYTYNSVPGGSDNNTLEVYAGISMNWLSGKLSFAEDVASTGDSGFYLETNAAYPLANVEGLSLLGHAGYGFGDVYADETFDWSVGLGYDYKGFNLSVRYVDSDAPGADSRVVAALSTTLPWSK
jgi:uncharacterized protein (TIGR02001 family)